MKLIPYEEIKARLLENPDVRAEYERLQPEFQKMFDAKITTVIPLGRECMRCGETIIPDAKDPDYPDLCDWCGHMAAKERDR